MPKKRANSQGITKVEADAFTILSSSANVWTFEDKQRLISILTQLKRRTGDGFNFIKAVWNQVTEELNKYCTRQTPKTARIYIYISRDEYVTSLVNYYISN